MLARSKSSLLRAYNISYRWFSKELASVKPNEIEKFLSKTENENDTLNIEWKEMNDLHREYIQNKLKNNEPLLSSDSGMNANAIDYICLSISSTSDLRNEDALNITYWLNGVLSSPTNQIKHIVFDASDSDSDTNNENSDIVFDSACINSFCEGIRQNPQKATEMLSIEFDSISFNTDDVQLLFDTILLKCKYCEYLRLENCNLNENDLNIIYNFYNNRDYLGLIESTLKRIDIYNNFFESKLFFLNHPLVELNTKLKKMMSYGLERYGDFFRMQDIKIETNDPYFKYCLLPNVRMTYGQFGKNWILYIDNVVRYNRREWSESLIKRYRKWSWRLISFVIFASLAINIVAEGKENIYHRTAIFLGMDYVKKRKPSQKRRKKGWWKRVFSEP